VRHSCRPGIGMVKSAQDRSSHDDTTRHRRAWQRRLQLNGTMRAIVVVVVHELRDQSEQMPLVDDDNVVKTFLAKGPHDSFGD